MLNHYISSKLDMNSSLCSLSDFFFADLAPLYCCCNSALQNDTDGLLICTLISKNQSLEKSRYISNPRKILGSANLDIFSSFAPGFFSSLWYKPSFFQDGDLGFEIDFDFSKPWFSEIRMQIKRPIVSLHLRLRGKQQFKFYSNYPLGPCKSSFVIIAIFQVQF